MPDPDRINRAVQECLSGCREAKIPLAAVIDYMAKLRTEPDWTKEEADTVERIVLRMLKVLVERPSDLDGK